VDLLALKISEALREKGKDAFFTARIKLLSSLEFVDSTS